MNRRDKFSDSPRLEQDDSLEIKVRPHPFTFDADPKNPLNERIVEAINRMGGVGERAEATYQATLDGLFRQAREVIAIVAKEYEAMPANQYLDRWSLIRLLVELKQPESLRFLDEILSSAIPKEESRNPQSFSTTGQEIVIRTTAIDAIARIAGDGNKDALELLLKHARHENFSVKRASIQAYLAHGGPEAEATLKRILPKNDHYILEIKRKDVREVPPIQGELHLACRDHDELPPRELKAGDGDKPHGDDGCNPSCPPNNCK